VTNNSGGGDQCGCLKIECPRHGTCEECRANHYGSGGLPYCERVTPAEASPST
jgi:hypothetical protein